MFNRYQDLINISQNDFSKNYSEDDTTIDTDVSDHDFYSNFMTSYRKTTQAIVSPFRNETSFQFSPENRNGSSIKRSKISGDYSKSLKFSYSPKPKSNKMQKSQILNSSKTPDIVRRSRQIKKRKKLKDYLTFDPVFDKYLNGSCSSTDDYEYYSYEEENIEQNIDDDIIDSVIESESYDVSAPVNFKEKKKNYQKAEILHPNVSTTSLKSINQDKSIKRSPFEKY